MRATAEKNTMWLVCKRATHLKQQHTAISCSVPEYFKAFSFIKNKFNISVYYSIYIVFYLPQCECPVWMHREPERTHTHVTHRMCVRTQITWTWLCTRGKKRYKYCSFSHTNRSFCVLGHQCAVTMGNCLIWISLCMFFFPLIETVTYTCHYMTDRLERFNLKTSKLDLLKKKRHLHLGCPWGKLIDTKF